VWGSIVPPSGPRALKNPRYAGAFAFGRRQVRRTPHGDERIFVPREQWRTLVRDAHPDYITWSDYEENVRLLLNNARPTGLTASMVRHARDRLCSRASQCAVDVADVWRSATT
jgi:hypothetical protein